MSAGPIREVSLREMVEAMAHLPDDTAFRWYQVSLPGPGYAVAGPALRVSLGEVRRELGMRSGDS